MTSAIKVLTRDIAFANFQSPILDIHGYTHIDAGAFEGRSDLVAIKLEGVLVIGDGAFQNCWNLQDFHFGNVLMTIGASAFSGCHRLDSLTFPPSIKSIKANAFAKVKDEVCINGHIMLPIPLQKIEFPGGTKNLVHLATSSFYNLTHTCSVNLGRNPKKWILQHQAFKDCSVQYNVV